VNLAYKCKYEKYTGKYSGQIQIINENENYIQIINDCGELYTKWENAFSGGQPKQPPAEKAFVLAGCLSNRQH
jgi:hypothetical protein